MGLTIIFEFDIMALQRSIGRVIINKNKKKKMKQANRKLISQLQEKYCSLQLCLTIIEKYGSVENIKNASVKTSKEIEEVYKSEGWEVE